MQVSGFTFVKNANLFAYPITESLLSLLPLCDEVVVAVGKSDDGTLETVKAINNEKIKIIETEWDSNLSQGGKIYAQQTNLAYRHCKGDWCFYLQADEVLSEKDYAEISKQLIVQYDNDKIDALLFKYKHFYGSYDYVGVGRQWYKREIRVIRNNKNFTSWGDAQGFRNVEQGKTKKLKAKEIDATIYHYGWVRPPKEQNLKIKVTGQNYYRNQSMDIKEIIKDNNNDGFDYLSAYTLQKFEGQHPQLMLNRINKDREWTKNFDPSRLKKKPFLHLVTDKVEDITGYRIGEYKDFIVVK